MISQTLTIGDTGQAGVEGELPPGIRIMAHAPDNVCNGFYLARVP